MSVKILEWAAALALIFLTAVVALFLSGAEIPQNSGTFFGGSLADWVQAVATVLAVVVAWRAYRDWWQPDLARSKAAQAPQLLIECKALVDAVRISRLPRSSFSLPIHMNVLKRVCRDQRRQRVNACREVWANVSKVRLPIIDEDVRKEFAALCLVAARVINSFDLVDLYVIDSADDDDLEDDQETLAEALIVCGLRVRHTNEPDEIEDQLREGWRRIESRLRHHMNYKADV